MVLVIFVLLYLSLPVALISGLILIIRYSTLQAKEDIFTLLGSVTGLIALMFFWSSKIFIPHKSFSPGGVEGCIDLNLYIAAVAFSVIAIWLLFRSKRRLAFVFALALLIMLSVTYAGAMLETYG